jgi:hypothetical protein
MGYSDAAKQRMREGTLRYESELADRMKIWLQEVTTPDEGGRVRAMDLYARYCEEMRLAGITPLSMTIWGQAITLNLQKRKIGGQVYYLGIRLKNLSDTL